MIAQETPPAARPAPAPAPDAAAARAFARAAYANFQDLVKAADKKATALVTVQALLLAFGGPDFVGAIGAAVGRIGARPLATEALDLGFLAASGAFVCSALASVTSALSVLGPRSPRHIAPPPGARGWLWTEALAPYTREPGEGEPPLPAARYAQALLEMTEEDRVAEYAFENLKVAWILDRKYAALRRAMVRVRLALFTAGLTGLLWITVSVRAGR